MPARPIKQKSPLVSGQHDGYTACTLDDYPLAMKKTFWVWITISALTMLAIGFATGAYVGFRWTLLFFVRRDVRAFGPDHDEFVWLGKYGSREDIPSLLYGLKQQSNSVLCTHGHCLDALHTLSGASPGDTYSDWTNWWVKEMKEPVPDWHPLCGLVPWKKFIQQDGAANGSQPIRSDTNSTPVAAGSRR